MMVNARGVICLSVLSVLGGCDEASNHATEMSSLDMHLASDVRTAETDMAHDSAPSDSGGTTEGCLDGYDSGLTDPAVSFGNLEEGRYCEVLVVYANEDGTILADVYNSLPFGPCPQTEWDALDEAAIAMDFPDALSIRLNGPRYFLMQDLFGTTPPGGVPMIHDFGGVRMVKAATVQADDIGQNAYTRTTVNRSNTWRFRAQQRVHEIIDDEGRVYVMQSFAQIVDPELSYDDLDSLGNRLQIPDGWMYRTRVLETALDVQAEGTATVLQDELQNTYQLRSDCQLGD